IGQSLTLLRALRNARASSTKSGLALLLIQGEKGAGKEELARYIHDHSRQKQQQRFVRRDLSAVAETLVEVEIYGHTKGAFTGATGERKSAFEEAGQGTVFLDEIGNLPKKALQSLLSATGTG